MFLPTVPEEFKHILKPDINCVEFKYDLSDFEDKVRRVVSDSEYRNRIANYFSDNQRSTYSWDGVAKTVISYMETV